jgi:hypothetical protein
VQGESRRGHRSDYEEILRSLVMRLEADNENVCVYVLALNRR